MRKDEWDQVLATAPATPNQRGAIMREFGRLGFHPRYDRAERLAACAALLGVDELGSTADLTQGQAGQLVNVLRLTTDRAALARAAAAPADCGTGGGHHGQDQGDELAGAAAVVNGPVSLPAVLAWIVAAICAAVRGERQSQGSGPVKSPGKLLSGPGSRAGESPRAVTQPGKEESGDLRGRYASSDRPLPSGNRAHA